MTHPSARLAKRHDRSRNSPNVTRLSPKLARRLGDNNRRSNPSQGRNRRNRSAHNVTRACTKLGGRQSHRRNHHGDCRNRNDELPSRNTGFSGMAETVLSWNAGALACYEALRGRLNYNGVR